MDVLYLAEKHTIEDPPSASIIVADKVFNLVDLTPPTCSLLKMVVTTPSLLEKIAGDRSAFFSIFGDKLDLSDLSALELLAEVFLPVEATAVPQIYNGCSCWSWVST